MAEIRKGFGLTQAELAMTLSLTQRKVAEIEAGTANPTLEKLEEIGWLLGFGTGSYPNAVDANT